MAKKKTSKRGSRIHRAVYVLGFLAIGILSVFVIQAVQEIRAESRVFDELSACAGSYKFESVSSQMTQKVGEVADVQVVGHLLALHIQDDTHEFKLIRLGDDLFELKPGSLQLEFVRGEKGRVIGIVSKPNPQAIHFVLRKYEKGVEVSNEPLER
jgi:hypothetical protein